MVRTVRVMATCATPEAKRLMDEPLVGLIDQILVTASAQRALIFHKETFYLRTVGTVAHQTLTGRGRAVGHRCLDLVEDLVMAGGAELRNLPRDLSSVSPAVFHVTHPAL